MTERLARRLLIYLGDMRHTAPARHSPNVVFVAGLVTVFILCLAMIGVQSAVAAAADAVTDAVETDCAVGHEQTLLVGLAGNTVSLLAKEALGLLKIGVNTVATLTLALSRNLGGIGLWAYAVYLAMMSHLVLIVAAALLLSVVYTRKAPRS